MKRLLFITLLSMLTMTAYAQMDDEQIRNVMIPVREAFALVSDLESPLNWEESGDGYHYSSDDGTLHGQIFYNRQDDRVISTTIVMDYDGFTRENVSLEGRNIVLLSYSQQDMTGVVNGRLRIEGGGTNRLNWDNTRIRTHSKTLLPYEGKIYMEGGTYNVSSDWFR